MITIEREWEEDIITILDPHGRHEDITLYLSETLCFIRQWNEESECYDVIECNAPMIEMMMKSYNLEEGTYVVETVNGQ